MTSQRAFSSCRLCRPHRRQVRIGHADDGGALRTLNHRLPQWQRDDERRTLVRLAAGRDRAAVALGDFTADRQPDASSLVNAAAVEALEDVEDPVEILLV